MPHFNLAPSTTQQPHVDSFLTLWLNDNIMQSTILTATIEPEYAGLRLDQVLAQLFPEYSRERLKSWVQAGQCRVNGRDLRPRDKVSGGEEVVISAQLATEITWQGEDLPLNIIYEDEDLLVIDKPAGVVVHPAVGNYSGTLVNALLNYDPDLQHIPRAGIVHRLDKNTSGLLVVARSLPAHTSLVSQLQERSIKRIYATVVHGTLVAGGTIDKPLGRHPRDRKMMAVVSDGKEAITHYRILQKFAKHAYLQVELETGRTHQIRVHMAHIRHPIVGDNVYAKRIQHNFPRQALHATQLSFIHPRTGEELSWNSPLPQDIQQLIAHCQQM